MTERSLAEWWAAWPDPASPRLALAGWWEDLLTGSPSPFQRACQASLQPEAPEPGDWEPLLQHFHLLEDGGRAAQLLPMVRLHLALTDLLRRHGRWTTPQIPPELDPQLDNLAQRYGQPVGFVRDLARFLSGGETLPAEATLRLRVALIEGEQAHLVPLHLERVEGPDEGLYPHPRQAFLAEDAEFQEAREAARAYVRSQDRWMPGRSVRWSLELPRELEGKIRQVKGPSMGAAFAAGLLRLFTLPVPSAAWL